MSEVRGQEGDLFHSLWTCSAIHSYWQKVLLEWSKVLGRHYLKTQIYTFRHIQLHRPPTNEIITLQLGATL